MCPPARNFTLLCEVGYVTAHSSRAIVVFDIMTCHHTVLWLSLFVGVFVPSRGGGLIFSCDH